MASQDVGKMHSRLVKFSFGLFLSFDSNLFPVDARLTKAWGLKR